MTPPQQAISDFPPGVSYFQPLSANDPLELIYQTSISQRLGSVAQEVVQGAKGTIQFAGNVVVQINNTAQSAEQLVSQTFNYVSIAESNCYHKLTIPISAV